jgi:Holliday junction resolvasome RuvABC endonuclease subunit
MSGADSARRQRCASVAPEPGLILGIDPGLAKCGWALLRGDSLVEGCGHWTTDGDATPEERVDDIGWRVAHVVRNHDIELVCAEAFVFQGGPASWNGLKTIQVLEHLRMVCRDAEVPYTTVTPAAPKKRLKIKGKPTHEQISAAFVGVPRVTSAHARDAIVVAWAGWMKGVE